jgi:RNA polymerase sigma factor (sigma-70 family)
MVLAALTDAQLVARCREGEEAAWNELVSRFSRYVFGIAVQAFRLSEHDAEDVFQDCFSRVYENLDKLRDDSALRPWIGQLTRRLCIDRLRSGGREHPAEEEELLAVAEDTMGTLDEAMTVHEALAGLSGDCREILDRFFAQDESYKTIADALDLPSGTIASRISRCLAKLREVLEGKNPGPEPV